MVSDRDMVLDVLHLTKHEIDDYTKAMQEVSNQSLRQMFSDLRGRAEQTQQQLAQFAISKGWYIPPSSASPQEIQRIRSHYEQMVMQPVR
ncbi:MAG: spore coat protein [Limnochordia bacterium]|jgi:spore coat protein CotF